MATLEELLAEVGLGETSGQTKTASQEAPSTSEVNQVLENLGLNGLEDIEATVTKTASQERNGMNGLRAFYDELFAEETPAADPQEPTVTKTASEGDPEAAAAEGDEAQTQDGDGEPTSVLGELTGVYFNVLNDSFFDKVAGDAQAEAGAGHAPQGPSTPGQLASIIGNTGDPAMKVNHDASSGKGLITNPGNQTPYNLKATAQIKQYLKRRMKSEPGDVGGYNE